MLAGTLLLAGLGVTALLFAFAFDAPAIANPTFGAGGEAIARRYYTAINEAIGAGDLALLDSVMEGGGGDRGPGTLAAGCALHCRVAALHRLAPDMRLVIEDIVADEDRLAVRLRVDGVERFRFLGLPLQGELSPWATVDFLRVADGRVAAALPEDGPPIVIEPLARTEIDAMPPAPYRLGLIRLTLEPGASLHRLSAAGPLVLLVESGTLEVRTDLPVAIHHPARDGQAEREDTSVGLSHVTVGDHLLLATDTGYQLHNAGNEPNTVLAAVALAGDGAMTNRWVRAGALDETLFKPGHPEIVAQDSTPVPWPPGVLSEVLVDGVISESSTAPTLGVARLTLRPQATLPVHRVLDAEMLAIESGSAAVDLVSGDGVMRPRHSAPQERIWPPGDRSAADLTIAPGGGAAFQSGASAGVRNSGAEPLEVLILSLETGPAAP